MEQILPAIASLSIGNIIMFIIGGILIYLAVRKDYEPMLLLPIGFGAILVNIPFSSALQIGGEDGFLRLLFKLGIETELFPVLIFIAIGAMIDFTTLFQFPKLVFIGAAAQIGIFATMFIAIAMNFDLQQAASIGVIGSADGPTSIFVSSILAKDLLGPISVAAYSYMALVPIIQPPVARALTTRKERLIRMDYKDTKVPKTVLILFPVVITLITGLISPMSVTLVGLLMFGNLIRTCGVLERLSSSF